MEENAGRKLIFILGQAAQGKTTLASSYVSSLESPTVWITMEPVHSDPVNLFHSLAEAFARMLPETDSSSLIRHALLTLEHMEETLLFKRWSQALFNRASEPNVLVIFDGLDRLDAKSPSFPFLQTLLDTAPPNLHFISGSPIHKGEEKNVGSRAGLLSFRSAPGYARRHVRARYLETGLAPIVKTELIALSRHSNRRIREGAMRLRERIHRAGLPRIHIETLGGFRVWRGKEPIEEGEWKAKQPKLLLKAIVGLGGSRVSRQLLVDYLWPNAAPAAGEKSFRAVLHHLRRVLETSSEPSLGSSYVHSREGVVSLDEALCSVDANDFEAFCRRADRMDMEKMPKEAIDWYDKSAALYRGDFLPVDSHELFASRRQALKTRHLDSILRLAGCHESLGSSKKAIACYKKVLEIDPTLEPAYQKLMMVYGNLGMRSSVLKLYEECRKTFARELDA